VQRLRKLRVRNLPNCPLTVDITIERSAVKVAQRVPPDSTLGLKAVCSVVVEVVQVGIEEAISGQLECRAVAVGPATLCSPINVPRRINRQVAGIVGRGFSVRAIKREDHLESVLARSGWTTAYLGSISQ
jgi:hypothetical protein